MVKCCAGARLFSTGLRVVPPRAGGGGAGCCTSSFERRTKCWRGKKTTCGPLFAKLFWSVSLFRRRRKTFLFEVFFRRTNRRNFLGGLCFSFSPLRGRKTKFVFVFTAHENCFGIFSFWGTFLSLCSTHPWGTNHVAQTIFRFWRNSFHTYKIPTLAPFFLCLRTTKASKQRKREREITNMFRFRNVPYTRYEETLK